MEAAKAKKGSGEPNRNKVATVTWDQVKNIAEDKMPDLNAFTIESAMKMVAGTARSMGFRISENHHFNFINQQMAKLSKKQKAARQK